MTCRFRSLTELAEAACLYQRLLDEGFTLGLSGGCITVTGPRPLDDIEMDTAEDWLLTFASEPVTVNQTARGG